MKAACLALVLAGVLVAAPDRPGASPRGEPLAASSPDGAPPTIPIGELDWVCPMDRDVRADKPGVCPRCGMKLVLGIPDDVEYPMDLKVSPEPARSGQSEKLTFVIRDPKTDAPVQRFELVHEKLFHMFLVSQDLNYFIHDHPTPKADGSFEYEEVFPKPGLYRILADFYPEGGTPQLIAKTLIVPGPDNSLPPIEDAKLQADLTPKHATNLDVELKTIPEKPIAGMKTMMFFKVKPADGLEKYLGAWGHMLAASDDLVDLIHNHPFLADGGETIQFNMIFPRAHTYRVWVQFQRKGVVNTAEFTVPVSNLE